MPSDTPSLVKPFTAQVASNGIAVATITQTTHGLAWIVYQIGFALAQQAPSPQVAAHFNSQPLVASAPMQVSAFASLPTQAPYAMETFFYGPPYITLESGDQIVCAVTGANSGDVFTATAYVQEITSPAMVAAMNAQQGYASGHIPRAGMRRW
jgi:hypothetical protein